MFLDFQFVLLWQPLETNIDMYNNENKEWFQTLPYLEKMSFSGSQK